VGAVEVSVTDMDRAVAFWSQVLGYRPREQRPDPERTMLIDPAGRGPAITLRIADEVQAGPEPVHLDVYVGERAKHVERLVALGATVVDDGPDPGRQDSILLRDPDGNEFRVVAHD
jgi:catechol 2,3-dioxygenase-like lactoylglutathione lyase family enzyme